MFDPHLNFAVGFVATAPDPPGSGTSLTLESGEGSRFADPATDGEFNIVVHPAGELPTPGNAEVMRVTGRSGDVLTVTREAEDSSARTVTVGDTVASAITAKLFGDIEEIPLTVTVAADDAPDPVKRGASFVCDGTDDHVEINAAITAGGRVTLSAGTFTVSSSIVLDSDISLEGAGPGLTTIVLADDTDVSGVTGLDIDHVTIRGITFDFNGANQTEDRHGIRLEGVTDFWMDSCELFNAYHHNLLSVAPGSGFNERWYITNCRSEGAGQQTSGDGFRPRLGFRTSAGEGMGPVLTNCIARNNSHHGFHAAAGAVLTGCRSEASGSNNFYSQDVNVTLMGCIGLDSVGLSNVAFDTDAHRGVVMGGLFRGSPAGSDVIRFIGSGCRIIGATVEDAGRHGIHIEGARGLAASCRVSGTNNQAIRLAGQNSAAIDNDVETAGDFGIVHITHGCRSIGNRVQDTPNGIRLNSGVADTLVALNDVRGNSTSGIQDVGATNPVIVNNPGVPNRTHREVSADVTLTISELTSVINVDSSGGAVTVTLPGNGASNGRGFIVRRDGANAVHVAAASAQTIGGEPSWTLGDDEAAIGMFSVGGGDWKIMSTQGDVAPSA